MADRSLSDVFIALAKYGVGSVIALYLVYYMTTELNVKIDKLVTTSELSNQIQEQTLQAIKDLYYTGDFTYQPSRKP